MCTCVPQCVPVYLCACVGTCWLPGSTFGHLFVLLGTCLYFWVPDDTFWYLVVLLGTWCYFWIPGATFEYLMVLLGTWCYFWVPGSTFGYLVELLCTLWFWLNLFLESTYKTLQNCETALRITCVTKCSQVSSFV